MSLPAISVDLPAGWRHRTDVAPFALRFTGDGFVIAAAATAADADWPDVAVDLLALARSARVAR